MGLKEQFIKQGGMKLLQQYFRGGALFTALGQFVLLGRSRTALELLRLSAQLKTKQKLEKQYKKYILEQNETYKDTLEHITSDKVWICWFQGMEHAPEIVKRCYESIERNMPDKEIILITEKNMSEYVTFPGYIMDKWEKGYITHTHMTDLLRLELLINHGGTWIDATVFCSGSDIPDYFTQSDLFFYQTLKPGRDGQCCYISSWFMSAKTNNRILMQTRQLCYEYWKTHNKMVDYFLLHSFMSIVLEYYEEEWKRVPPRDNATPHILLLRLFEQYDEDTWNMIRNQTPFHKLTYKFNDEQTQLEGTYYKKIIEDK